VSGQSRHLKEDISLPPGITRREWHELCDQLIELCDQLIELEAAGALDGIRAVVAERLCQVRTGGSLPIAFQDACGIILAGYRKPPVPDQCARAAALLAAEIDRQSGAL
jgi:hypothetical protein